MFTPPSLTIALLMMITSAICWGSWANTYKGVKNYRFELFYWDYAVGIFVISLILALTMGSSGHDSSSFLPNVHAADWSNIISTMVGGAIFNLANLLLVAAIDMAGLAVAFPVSIGIALVVGVVLSYTLQPKGNAALLALGVACAVVAVVLDGKAYGSLRTADKSASRSASKKSIIICVVSGVLMGLWNPFVAYGATRGNALSPYSSVVFLTLGALLSCFIWNLYFMKRPLVGDPVSFGGFFSGPPLGHLLGLFGGFVWGLGTVFNVVAGKVTSYAISYAIGQSAPMVAALWGVFAWKEFSGSGPRAKIYLTLMFVFYALAIVLVARASG
jgi:glucose uptake protein